MDNIIISTLPIYALSEIYNLHSRIVGLHEPNLRQGGIFRGSELEDMITRALLDLHRHETVCGYVHGNVEPGHLHGTA